MNTQNEATSNQQANEQSTLGNLISSIGLPPQYVNDQRDTRIE
ncbi:MAG: hypothetical protein WBF95_08975 [Comamonas thiooxydans]